MIILKINAMKTKHSHEIFLLPIKTFSWKLVFSVIKKIINEASIKEVPKTESFSYDSENFKRMVFLLYDSTL